MEVFVTPVSMRQRYVEDASRRKVFLNLKKIKKLFVVRYQGEVSVGIVVVGKNLCLKKIERNLKKFIHHHL